MFNDPLGNRPLPQVLPPPYEVQVLFGDHGTLIDHESELLEAARNGDINALNEYTLHNGGVEIYNASISGGLDVNGLRTFFDRGGTINFTDHGTYEVVVNAAKVDQTGSNMQGGVVVLGWGKTIEEGRKIDWGGVANASSYERAFRYYYDALSRDTAAIYAERTTASTGAFTTTHGWDEDRISYDQNGNILSLYRNSATQGAGTHTGIDNLAYTYSSTNPNQLLSVTDGTGASYTGAGFRNLTGGTGNYTYDGNGNLTSDPYKGFAGISHNVLNRTERIYFSSSANRYIDYSYNMDGTLLRKRQYDNVGGVATLQATTDYIDGFVYLNGTLQYFAMPEGRVLNSGGTLSREYTIADQQGNVRVTFDNTGTGGIAKVRQENSYYAFGLIMPGSTVATPTNDIKNLYNGGSEWQNDFGNLPDYYQAYYRNYDAALGRWTGVDPMAESTESMTGYQYANNIPVMMNDPMGNLSQSQWDFVLDQLYNGVTGNYYLKDEQSGGSGGGGANNSGVAGNNGGFDGFNDGVHGGSTAVSEGARIGAWEQSSVGAGLAVSQLVYENPNANASYHQALSGFENGPNSVTGGYSFNYTTSTWDNNTGLDVTNHTYSTSFNYGGGNQMDDPIKGIHAIYESETPTIYRNTLNAIKNGLPYILHYDPSLIKTNRNILKNYPVVSRSVQRDEYPYASTREGGSGLVFYVPGYENSLQGQHLMQLYSTLKPGDAFLVFLIPRGHEPENEWAPGSNPIQISPVVTAGAAIGTILTILTWAARLAF